MGEIAHPSDRAKKTPAAWHYGRSLYGVESQITVNLKSKIQNLKSPHAAARRGRLRSDFFL